MPLTDRQIRTAKPTEKPYKLGDGGGLFLQITPRGSKLWRLKYSFDGQEKLLSLGAYPDVPLRAARMARDDAKSKLAASVDPSVIKKLEKALFAFLLMSGIRLSAIASLRSNTSIARARCVFLSGRDVRTKASKTMTTYLLSIDHEVADCFDRWLDHFESKMLFGPSDPLFPKTRASRGNSGGFSVTGLERDHWTSAGPIRGIIKSAFEAAGLPKFTPHSFRRTI